MNRTFTLFFFVIVLLGSCKEKSYIYEVNEVTVTGSSSNASKGKEKRPEQFIAILYANVFQKPLSPNELVELSELIQSIGDKQVAYEVIVSQFLCNEDAQIPSNSEMRNDVASFVEATYQRFYVRLPSNAEHLKIFISLLRCQTNTIITNEEEKVSKKSSRGRRLGNHWRSLYFTIR